MFRIICSEKWFTCVLECSGTSSRTSIPVIRKSHPETKEKKEKYWRPTMSCNNSNGILLVWCVACFIALFSSHKRIWCQFFLRVWKLFLGVVCRSLYCCSLDMMIEALGSCHWGRKEVKRYKEREREREIVTGIGRREMETKESSERLKRQKICACLSACNGKRKSL